MNKMNFKDMEQSHSDDKGYCLKNESYNNGVLFTDNYKNKAFPNTIGRKGIVFSILAWCCIIGIVVYLYIDASKGRETYHQTTHSRESVSPSYYINSPKKYNSTTDRTNDDEYWNSVSRQKELEDLGMEGAANMERNARQEYMRGGGYHSLDGTPQVQFQGSQEQAEQLREMDEMGW